ncbi:MAG: phosphoribosylanthranilate isomerase [Endomicrobiaceae bacterium]|nr:phosphoribosylanthranilate isomerase [Endomicrobiaceae bacterium]
MAKIKICGLFRDCDIDFVNEAMPDYIGFVFAKSHRQISVKQADLLRKKLNKNIISVGVFVNNSIEEIQKIYNDGIISIAQLHGSEDNNYIAELRKNCKIEVVKSVNASTGIDIQKIKNINADFLLFDGGTGGEGKTFDWKILSEIEKPFFLAGGLNIDNIDEAIKKVKPYAVDLSSGVETDRVKDKQKILNIVRRVKNV